jgi:uncharacterized membrane protein
MHAPTGNAAPPRSVFSRLLLRSWDYRHPRTCACVRFAVGIWLVFLGGLLLSDGYLLATLLLLLLAAAVLFWVGHLDMTAARSAPPRT